MENQNEIEKAPVIGVFTSETASVPGSVTESETETLPGDTAGDDDIESQKAIFEQKIYAELHARAQHLMDFVYQHKLTRAQVLVALMDRA